MFSEIISVLLNINNGTTMYSWYTIDHVLAASVNMTSKIVLLLFLLAFPVAVLAHNKFNKNKIYLSLFWGQLFYTASKFCTLTE